MFELPTIDDVSIFNYADLAVPYLHGISEAGIIPANLQKQLLNRFEQGLSAESFITITDVGTGSITYCKGVHTCLGVADSVFSSKKWAELLHPSQKLFQSIYARAFFEVVKNHPIVCSAQEPLLVQTLALKSSGGAYSYFLRKIYPYQLLGDGCINSYLSAYTLIKGFDNELFHYREPLPKKHKWMKRVQKQVQHLFKVYSGFTTREYLQLCRYAADEQLTNAKLAATFKISEAAVQKNNQRMLEHCREQFHIRFARAGEAAAFFKKVGVVVGG